MQFTPTNSDSKSKPGGNPTMLTLRNSVAFFFWASAAFLMVSQAAAAPKPTVPGILLSASGEPSSFSCKNTACSGPAQFDFWIWCTAPSSTSSGDCRGSMFFYNIKPTAVQVTGAVTVTGTTATMTVSSSTTASMAVACTLLNNSLVPGRSNTVTVTCDVASWTKPGPSGASTTKADAIVKIVMPPSETSSVRVETGDLGFFPKATSERGNEWTLISFDREIGRNAGRRV